MSFLQQLTFMLAVILATIFIISLVFNQTYDLLPDSRESEKIWKKNQNQETNS